MKTFPPVIKWFGSKRPVAQVLAEYFRQSETYYEPFIGGGAMLPYAKSNLVLQVILFLNLLIFGIS